MFPSPGLRPLSPPPSPLSCILFTLSTVSHLQLSLTDTLTHTHSLTRSHTLTHLHAHTFTHCRPSPSSPNSSPTCQLSTKLTAVCNDSSIPFRMASSFAAVISDAARARSSCSVSLPLAFWASSSRSCATRDSPTTGLGRGSGRDARWALSTSISSSAGSCTSASSESTGLLRRAKVAGSAFVVSRKPDGDIVGAGSWFQSNVLPQRHDM